jgi:hypothetical protein
MLTVSFIEGTPANCGRYLVSDGEEISIDTYWEFIDGKARMPSQIGVECDGKIERKWMKYENVKYYAPLLVTKT